MSDTVTMPISLARSALGALRDLIRESRDPGSGTLAVEWQLAHLVGAEPGDALPPMPGAERIAAERRRQVEAEGWTPEHDDEHVRGELARAAAGYALSAAGYPKDHIYWPAWAPEWDKRPRPSAPRADKIRALEKAGALIASEIDRLLRAEAST